MPVFTPNGIEACPLCWQVAIGMGILVGCVTRHRFTAKGFFRRWLNRKQMANRKRNHRSSGKADRSKNGHCEAVDVLKRQATVLNPSERVDFGSLPQFAIWPEDVEKFLDQLPEIGLFDLVVTSPPYNLGKAYEDRQTIDAYTRWQERVIRKCVARLQPTGSICWQVGNHILERRGGRSTSILPLDYVFHTIFDNLGLQMRNRIVWRFGHGLHCKHRFSGRYEIVLWYTRSDEYIFDLDAVRVPSKYPGKKHFKGPRAASTRATPLERILKTCGTFPMSRVTTLRRPTIRVSFRWL